MTAHSRHKKSNIIHRLLEFKHSKLGKHLSEMKKANKKQFTGKLQKFTQTRSQQQNSTLGQGVRLVHV